MTDERLKRINELARKSKTSGLTPEETLEQAQLRREYLKDFRKSFEATLDRVYIVDGNGKKTKLTDMKKD